MLAPALVQRLLVLRAFLTAACCALLLPAAHAQVVDFTAASQNGPEAGAALTATVQMSSTAGAPVVIDYTVTGTALEGTDFSVAPNPVTIPMGSQQAVITITLMDDGLDEADETIVLTLLDPANADLGTVTVHTATVDDDDPEPTFGFDLAASNLGEEAGSASLALTLSAASGRTVSVPFTLGGTALSPDDYTLLSANPLVLAPGETTAMIDFTLSGDGIFEGDETLQVDLGVPTNATLGANPTHVLTLNDDETQPTVEFDLVSQTVTEAVGSTGVGLTLSGPSALPVSVGYQSTGSAVEPADFSAAPNPAVFAAGETQVMVQIDVVDDGDIEGQEAIELTLDPPSGATLGAQTVHTTQVTDNEGPAVDFQLATQAVGEELPSAVVTLELSAMGLSDIEVPLTVAGSATDGADYTLSPNPVVFPAGSLTQDVTVTLLDDALDEFDETVDLTLGTPTNAMLGSTTNHVLTLTDDEPLPTVQFREGIQSLDETAGPLALDLDLSEVSGRDVILDISATGKAKLGPDYSLAPLPLTIPAGSASGQLVFTPNDDALREGAERAVLSLQSLTHADPGGQGTTVVRILDDEGVTAQPTTRALSVDVTSIDFGGPVRGGEMSVPQTVTVRNDDEFSPVRFDGAVTRGGDKDSFSVSYPEGAPPMLLMPGEETTFEVFLSPTVRGDVESSVVVRQSPAGVPAASIEVSGLAVGPTGGELLVNVADLEYGASDGETWNAEYGLVQTNTNVFTTPGAVVGTDDPDLYAKSRRGAAAPIVFAFDLDNGAYDVILHFVEPTKEAVGRRVMDVTLEGVLAVAGLDLFAEAGLRAAYQHTLRTTVTDGQLDLSIVGTVSNPVLAAIEVRSVPVLSVTPETLDYFIVDQGEFTTQLITVDNTGLHQGLIDTVTFQLVQGSAQDFSIEIDGQEYFGADVTASHSVSSTIPAGGSVQFPVNFLPSAHADHELDLQLAGPFDEVLEVSIGGTGGANADWGFLHPVLDSDPSLIVDYELDGSEDVQLLGSESHTHEPGHVLTSFQWSEGGMPFASVADPMRTFPLGDTTIELLIADDNMPADSASDSRTVSVFSANAVPGILAIYYSDRDPLPLLDAVPAQADFVERLTQLQINAQNGLVSSTPYAGDVMVQLQADFVANGSSTYEFVVSGGTDSRVEVDGNPMTGPVVLSAGNHALEVRVAIETLAELPVSIDALVDSVSDPGFGGTLTHGELGVVPVIHDMPTIGNDLGGNQISIFGFGFYPASQVVVHWGAQDFNLGDLQSYSAERLDLLSPPGMGSVQVSVETPAGISSPRTFTYSPTGPVPVAFVPAPAEIPVSGATCGEWGPDGRLYVGQISGEIKAITFDENYAVLDVQTYTGVSNFNNSDILGLAFNPWDPPSPVRIYVSHGHHFVNGGGSFSGPSPYTGQVSVLTGPDFDAPQEVIKRLPTSNHDHSVMGMVFDDNGDLLVCVGGNTNAGVKWPQIGDLPESPLSGALLELQVWHPDYNTAVTYIETATGVVNNDQVFGDVVDVSPNTTVGIVATGLRNAYGLELATWGQLYMTDNGPNGGFGPESTGPMATSGNHPSTDDELLLIEPSAYYGHPNRNRGRYDPRQNVYHDVDESSIAGVFTQNIAKLDSSTNGIAEYRAQTFNSKIRGEMLKQKWNFRAQRVKFNATRDAVVEVNDIFPQVNALDVTIGPGGAIVSVDYSGNRVAVLVPDDVSIVGLAAHDIFPWRAPSGGGTPFVIGGENFGTSLPATSVTFDGIPATLTSVSERRIHGVVPAHATPPEGLVDVEITVGLNSVMIPGSFHFLQPTPGAGHGLWTTKSPVPQPVGEVSAAVLGGEMYLVGEGTNATFAYDVLADTWRSDLAVRPFVGNHHGSEVVDGKWYLIGGLTSGGGQVQIYDPVADSWTTGATMPWSGGSVSTCVIDGEIYAAGGIVGSSTVVNAARYDPQADTWTTLTDMPTGVNHAAASTDGSRFFVFGGRQGPNVPQPGFDEVQIYDPVGGSWETSAAPLSELEPLPEGRGGTGRAVFYRGEFYVMGGETSDAGDPSATMDGVFPHVYAYDPVLNTWRRDADLPTPRHGIFPVRFQGRVLVAGGGVVVGNSQTTELEVFKRY